ncbi:PREDICTED: E3 ubiquitin-protein ligase RNF149 [Gekko japonicus]|uniref:E3 ubiquitin-protein ligase RNF149 n=1 Tax=Gekko japonicus TaxID=146911 RepID=A0ABM1KX16_GEKJA|nr:PREDICTED: E3 ubiquitin-protein ligase RNF149 [Gekko japonicus]XP_015278253.1 PREDICTED: E3 ubiquitin-protein ligase RNF149 [Gekko japonicus]
MLVVRRVALPVWLLLLLAAAGCPRVAWSLVWYSAWVTTVYTEPGTNRTVRGSAESGRYGDTSPKEGAQGLVGIPRGVGARPMEGCAPDAEYEVPTPPGAGRGGPPPSWIALVSHGGCRLKEKIANAARKRAAAVVIYNELQFGNSTLTMPHLGTGNTVVIMVGYPKGMEILEPVRRGIPVKMTIDVGNRHIQEYISGQSVVFVAIAFITMMIISLAWLIFFYIQRFLYTGTQFGNQGNRKEIKKVIGQLQLHIVKQEDKELDVDAENCAVCIENYKPKDTVRILPCKHVFHKTCIDPWLVDHRTCPMCKLDVIKALGCWGEPKDLLELAVPESISGSISAESWSITVQEEDRNDLSEIPASSAHDSTLNCSRLKEDVGETAALLETDGGGKQPEEFLSSGNSQ